jgi:hypothetical protein
MEHQGRKKYMQNFDWQTSRQETTSGTIAQTKNNIKKAPREVSYKDLNSVEVALNYV